jgi:hypothetical protein
MATTPQFDPWDQQNLIQEMVAQHRRITRNVEEIMSIVDASRQALDRSYRLITEIRNNDPYE